MKYIDNHQFAGLVILLALTACTAQSPTTTSTETALAILSLSPTRTPKFTLSITGDECTLDGPTTIPFGQLEITLVIDEPKVSEDGYAIMALDEGKTIADLKAWSSADQPEWADRLAGEHQMKAGTSSRTIDLVPMAAMQGHDSIYIVCFHTDTQTHVRKKLGALGPIVVER